jgi:hypothetical protein
MIALPIEPEFGVHASIFLSDRGPNSSYGNTEFAVEISKAIRFFFATKI